MSAQEATAASAELDHEREDTEKKQQPLVTENEEAFKGPRFNPPVYRRRYAAVCELVKKHQAKKVRYNMLDLIRREGVGCLVTSVTRVQRLLLFPHASLLTTARLDLK